MKKLIGPVIFIIIAAVIAWYQWGGGKDAVKKEQTPEKVAASVYLGGEKMAFVRNPQVQELLLKRHGIELNAVKAGSIEMVTELSTAGKDALWPSNQIAVEIFRNRGGNALAEENLFNSPVVLFAYDIVTEALIREKIVEKRTEAYYIVDLPKLIRYINAGKTWKDIGLAQLYGKIAIHSTNPVKSNSGNMFAGLMANILNNGTVVTEPTLPNVMPELTAYFQLRGHMEDSSGDLFKNFITTGVGAKPIIVGYENQLVEFIIANQKYIDYIRKKIRILYPEPTVWSSHPVIALTPNGKRLIEALKDDAIQKIAWEKHGFRSGLLGVENDPTLLQIAGIPKEITSVIPMPDAAVMDMIINALKH